MAATMIDRIQPTDTAVLTPGDPTRTPKDVETVPELSMKGIRKQWPGQPKPVLDGVDLEARAGSLTWIGGRNGAGKTTLLRIAASLIFPDAGRVSVAGMDALRSRRQVQRRIGFLPAGTSGLYARLTVRQHLEFWAKIALLPRDEGTAAVERMLDEFFLRELAGRRVDRLSMGQRQRVRVAMALLHDPNLVLLDEPRNSLDAEGMEVVTNAVENVRRRGGAILWCSPSGDAPQLDTDQAFSVSGGNLEPA